MPRPAVNSRYRCEATVTGAQLRELRTANRYSAKALGVKWGISTTAILTWEREENPLPCWVDRAVAETFGSGNRTTARRRPAGSKALAPEPGTVAAS